MKKIQNRLKRLEGQIRGLQKLLDDPNDCEKIIIQFSAAKSALDNCFSLLLADNLTKCLKQIDKVNCEAREGALGQIKDLDKILKLIIKK